MGQPLIQRVIRRLTSTADEILITSNHPERLTFLNLPVFQDLYPGLGALSGLFTALSAASHPLVAVVACDMAFANPDLLKAERIALVRQGADAVVPQTEESFQPFHAVYRRDVCRKSVEAALKAGERRADIWYSDVKMLYFSADEIRRYDPEGIAFINLNTPEELGEAEAYARQLGEGEEKPSSDSYLFQSNL
jgi:molybdopterin-guanine dinucleotide biosynthesis protein A